MSLRVIPVDVRQDGTPMNQGLYDAVQEYAKKELRTELNLRYYARVHALVREEGETVVVMGLLGQRAAIDVCLFHVTPPTHDKEGLKLAAEGRDLMIQRGNDYLADLGHTGQTALIFVAEHAERYWRKFLVKIGARPAHRYEIEIK